MKVQKQQKILNKKIVSVILARGGSKGIPQKNITDVNGQPLISYTIETSINSNVSKTWVSTDNDEIKSISLKYGAKVLDRPLKYATDISKSEDALLHFANNVDFDISLNNSLEFISSLTEKSNFKEL